ncbi:MAG: glycosyltransferase family 2 protein [Planctomycetota bacterium]|jgi:dolichol-phosphate mannosyltransferase
MANRLVSYVVPCFNEEETIAEFYARVRRVAEGRPDTEFEFLFVNDGSRDRTGEMLDGLAEDDPRVRVLHLAHNRGHQIALTAGLDFASGDVIVTIDADLQDPPELLDQFLRQIDGGFELVHAQRASRAGETWFKLVTARVFYWGLRRMSGVAIIENCGDFRAFTRPVLEAIRGFRTPHRFLRGMFVAVGFKQTVIQYDRDARFAGETKYPFLKMLRLALDAVLGFSTVPIRVITGLSLLLWAVSLVYLGVGLYERIVLGSTEPGWTSIVALLFFFTGLILFSMSIIGAYIGRMFVETQRPPMYWLRSASNIAVPMNDGMAANASEVDLSRRILSEPRSQ